MEVIPIPPVDEVVVVAVALGFTRIVKPLLYRDDCPSGLLTIISQIPIVESEGMGKVHVICADERTFTFVADIFELSDRTILTVAPFWNPSPRRSVIETDVPT